MGGGRRGDQDGEPAGRGTWTAVNTLDTQVEGFAVGIAVNSAGSAIITWAEPARTMMADSGSVLGGFGSPVTVDTGAIWDSLQRGPAARFTFDAYEGPGLDGASQVSGAYLTGHTQVVLSNSGEASVSWVISSMIHKMATRSPAGTWSPPVALPGPIPFVTETAVDGAGNVGAVYAQASAAGVSQVFLTRLPAGSSTWSTPVLLASAGSDPMVVGDTAGTFAAAFDTTSGLSVLTSPPGGTFGTATTFPGGEASGLIIAPGHATMIINSGTESTEPVS